MNPTTGDNNPVKLNLYLLRSALVAALGGLLFGFDTAVISGATKALTETYGLSPGMLGFTVSSALWGTVLGSIFAGIAVAAGAFGAHFLKGLLDPSMLAAFETAARYQMYHALGLCIVSWAIERYPNRPFSTVGP